MRLQKPHVVSGGGDLAGENEGGVHCIPIGQAIWRGGKGPIKLTFMGKGGNYHGVSEALN